MKWLDYFQLMRLDKPVGIYLLWAPTAWALWIANQGHPALSLVVWFLLGTIIMRSAGCVMNDIADRNIDCHVKRTHLRPLTSGKVTLKAAILLLLLLLIFSLVILLQLPHSCIPYAFAALFITFIYPFCKRFIQGPQLILGISFSMGIPMAFAASSFTSPLLVVFLLIINFLWVIAYDTQYAMVDRVDDLRIGVKSTAILFAQYDRLIIGILQVLMHLLWLALSRLLHFTLNFYLLWLCAASNLIYQQYLLGTKDEVNAFKAFKSNSFYGFIMWGAIALSHQ